MVRVTVEGDRARLDVEGWEWDLSHHCAMIVMSTFVRLSTFM